MRAEPERTCVGCRSRAAKGKLLRVVRSPRGDVEVDPSGSAQGRGAYLHRDPSCVRAAVRAGVLARALRTGLGENELGKLRHELEEHLRAT